jgi:lactoylglutathione lyase
MVALHVYPNFLSTLFEMKKLLFLFLLAFVFSQLKAQVKSPRVNHIAFSVQDLKKSTYFYTKIIRLDTIPEPFHDGRHTWLNIGDACHLHLIQNTIPVPTFPKNTHLCFTTTSVDQFADMLKQNKIAFEDLQGNPNSITTRVHGVKQIYLKDPDGYWLEINDAKE